ncbi:MAG: response regulator transcription factor [Nitrospirales bacterium]|nr:response regulator transcription factor [Nitrospira sp.]MDR4501493.1 response regulator transcription factor [Nitrospirales bacterium]
MSKNPQRIRLILIDENELMRTGMRTVLEKTAEFEIACEYDTPEDSLSAKSTEPVDILIWAISPENVNPLKTYRQLAKRYTHAKFMLLACSAEKQVFLTVSHMEDTSCMLKNIKAAELIRCLRLLHTGIPVLSSNLSDLLLQEAQWRSNAGHHDQSSMETMTEKEKHIAVMIAQGLTNKEIAENLNLSEKTIKNYISHLFGKLHVTRRSQIASLIGSGKLLSSKS